MRFIVGAAAGIAVAIIVALLPVKTMAVYPAERPHEVPSALSEKLGASESGNRDIGCHIDSNGKESCGRYQYQWDTWINFSKQSGITGSPLNRDDATRMTEWALGKGLGPVHWANCFKTHPEWLGAQNGAESP